MKFKNIFLVGILFASFGDVFGASKVEESGQLMRLTALGREKVNAFKRNLKCRTYDNSINPEAQRNRAKMQLNCQGMTNKEFTFFENNPKVLSVFNSVRRGQRISIYMLYEPVNKDSASSSSAQAVPAAQAARKQPPIPAGCVVATVVDSGCGKFGTVLTAQAAAAAAQALQKTSEQKRQAEQERRDSILKAPRDLFQSKKGDQDPWAQNIKNRTSKGPKKK